MTCLISPGFPKDSEEVKEEVENIQVEADGGVDVVLGRDAVSDHVRIKHNEEGENESPAHSYQQIHHLRLEENLQRENKLSSAQPISVAVHHKFHQQRVVTSFVTAQFSSKSQMPTQKWQVCHELVFSSHWTSEF